MCRKLAGILLAILVGLVAMAPPSWSSARQRVYERGPSPNEVLIRAERGPFPVEQLPVPWPAPGFGGGTIYYPADTTQGTFGGVAICPGLVGDQAVIAWFGPRLASHGFVVLTMSSRSPWDLADDRGTQLLAALDYLTSTSPPLIRQRLDESRLAIMGHSMGGGGVLRAAANRSPLKAAIALAPWHEEKDWSKVRVATMLMTGDQDLVARPLDHARRFYESMTEASNRAYASLKDADHLIFQKANPVIGKYTISWLKRFVDNDTRYDKFLCPPPPPNTELDDYRATCPY